MDKTGTITSGKPSVQGIKVYTNISMNDFISMAASLESGSLHPLGQAIVEYAKDKNINLQQPENFTNISGRGIQAKLNGHAYLAGNKRLLEEKNIRINQNVLSDLERQEKMDLDAIKKLLDSLSAEAEDWLELVATITADPKWALRGKYSYAVINKTYRPYHPTLIDRNGWNRGY